LIIEEYAIYFCKLIIINDIKEGIIIAKIIINIYINTKCLIISDIKINGIILCTEKEIKIWFNLYILKLQGIKNVMVVALI
jgi:hypothetical protein